MWTDLDGLHTAPTIAGTSPQLLAGLPADAGSKQIFFSVQGERVCCTRSVIRDGVRDASLGCVPVPSTNGAGS